MQTGRVSDYYNLRFWPFGCPVLRLLKSLHPDVRFDRFEKNWPLFDFTLKSLRLDRKSFTLEKTTVSLIRSWPYELRSPISLNPTDSKSFMILLTFSSNPYGQIGDPWIRTQNWPFCPSLQRFLIVTNFGRPYLSIRPFDLPDSKSFMFVLIFSSNLYSRIGDLWVWA